MELEFWEFFRQVLILLIIISLAFPLNVPLAAVAYKVRLGARPIPLSWVSFALRSVLYGRSDSLVVARVVRIANDGSATLVWRRLAAYDVFDLDRG